jgi:dTDP-4-amino-4,6-dideoxygalactose transaminase
VIGDLAVLGGRPTFEDAVHVGRPNVGDRDRLMQRIEAMLDRQWFSNDGPLVAELEQAFAAHHGVSGAVAVCNATLGLQLLARALDLSGEILMPSFTFIATAHSMMWQGARPEFVDIGLDDHNLDPAAVEDAIGDRTGAILGVHIWGRQCDVTRLQAIADAHGVPLLLDAAHALGVTGPAGPVGSGGAAEVLSLHATKFVNSFEGGIVLSDDAGLLDEVRSLRNFGFADLDLVTAIGTNAKMPEVCAAMGLTSLEAAPTFAEANRVNFETYAEHLDGVPGLRMLPAPDVGTWNHQYVVVEVDEATTGISRDQIADALWAENVLARRYFHPGCHRHPPYRTFERPWRLPNTDRVCERVLVLPTGTANPPETCRTVADLVVHVATGGRALSERIRSAAPPADLR